MLLLALVVMADLAPDLVNLVATVTSNSPRQILLEQREELEDCRMRVALVEQLHLALVTAAVLVVVANEVPTTATVAAEPVVTAVTAVLLTKMAQAAVAQAVGLIETSQSEALVGAVASASMVKVPAGSFPQGVPLMPSRAAVAQAALTEPTVKT